MNIYTIEQWFKEYDKWVHQAERKKELGLEWVQEDKILGVTYYNKHELLLKAEEMNNLHKQEKAKQHQQMIEWRKARGLEV